MKAKAKAEEMTREQLRYESAALCLMNELAAAADRCGWAFHDDGESNAMEMLEAVADLLEAVADLLEELGLLFPAKVAALVRMLAHYRAWAQANGTQSDRETAHEAEAAVLTALRNNQRLTYCGSAASACISAFNGYCDMISDRRKRDLEEEEAAKADTPTPRALTSGKEVLS